MATSRLVYLSGPISGLSFTSASDWREYAKARFRHGIRGVSPLRGKLHLQHVQQLESNAYASDPIASPRGITARDRYDTTRCDAMLVNLLGAEKVSIGTMIELGWADLARRPIVLAMEENGGGNLHEHAMVCELASYHVHSLDAAIELVNWLFADDSDGGEE